MKTFRQPETDSAKAAENWAPETVLAMNLRLLTHPPRDFQRWFEEQVAVHLGFSPHGAGLDSKPIA